MDQSEFESLLHDVEELKRAVKRNNPFLREVVSTRFYPMYGLIYGLLIILFCIAAQVLIAKYGSPAAVPSHWKTLAWFLFGGLVAAGAVLKWTLFLAACEEPCGRGQLPDGAAGRIREHLGAYHPSGRNLHAVRAGRDDRRGAPLADGGGRRRFLGLRLQCSRAHGTAPGVPADRLVRPNLRPRFSVLHRGDALSLVRHHLGRSARHLRPRRTGRHAAGKPLMSGDTNPGGSRSGSTGSRRALAALDLDKVIHERARLMILTYLASSDKAETGFTEIREELGMSAGNLSVQLRTLEEAGYVKIDKRFIENKPYTGDRP